MPRRRKRRLRPRRPRLTIERILAWADAFHERTGEWPRKDAAGMIAGTVGEKWLNVDMALRLGLRGLAGGSSLARLLAEHRGVRNHLALPRLSLPTILAWADTHRSRNLEWPRKNSGPIAGGGGETWLGVHEALVQGHRGLPGGSSLAKVLAEHRGVRHRSQLPVLTERRILQWADEHKRVTGTWPKRTSGIVPGQPGETWLAVHTALQKGQRGLPGGSSLARLLAAQRGVRNLHDLPRITKRQILKWACAYRQRTGRWPTRRSGPIADAPGETWTAVDTALQKGQRGLPGGSSLRQVRREGRPAP